MSPETYPRKQTRAWRAFPSRDGRAILLQVMDGAAPRCPWCARLLEARPDTRLAAALVLDARGYDLDCRGCRRFWAVVLHTPRSIRLLRMRRLAAAVRAAGAPPEIPGEATADAVMA